jgi:hypothetical protein
VAKPRGVVVDGWVVATDRTVGEVGVGAVVPRDEGGDGRLELVGVEGDSLALQPDTSGAAVREADLEVVVGGFVVLASPVADEVGVVLGDRSKRSGTARAVFALVVSAVLSTIWDTAAVSGPRAYRGADSRCWCGDVGSREMPDSASSSPE